MLEIKITQEQVASELQKLRLTDTPPNRQRAAEHLVRRLLQPPPFHGGNMPRPRAAADGRGKMRRGL